LNITSLAEHLRSIEQQLLRQRNSCSEILKGTLRTRGICGIWRTAKRAKLDEGERLVHAAKASPWPLLFDILIGQSTCFKACWDQVSNCEILCRSFSPGLFRLASICAGRLIAVKILSRNRD
jgi:hypothetical protein